jgi:hypothetical protein
MPEFEPDVVLFDQASGRYVALQIINGQTTVRIYDPASGTYTERVTPFDASQSITPTDMAANALTSTEGFSQPQQGSLPFGANVVVGQNGARAVLGESNTVMIYDANGVEMDIIPFDSAEAAGEFLDRLSFSEAQDANVSQLWLDAVNPAITTEAFVASVNAVVLPEAVPEAVPEVVAEPVQSPSFGDLLAFAGGLVMDSRVGGSVTTVVDVLGRVGDGNISADDAALIQQNAGMLAYTITKFVHQGNAEASPEMLQAMEASLTNVLTNMNDYPPALRDTVVNSLLSGNPDALGEIVTGAASWLGEATTDAERDERRALINDLIITGLYASGSTQAEVAAMQSSIDGLLELPLHELPADTLNTVITAMTANPPQYDTALSTLSTWVNDAPTEAEREERRLMVETASTALLGVTDSPIQGGGPVATLIERYNDLPEALRQDIMDGTNGDGNVTLESALTDIANWLNEQPANSAERREVIEIALSAIGMNEAQIAELGPVADTLIGGLATMPPAFRNAAIQAIGQSAGNPEALAGVFQDFVDYPLIVADFLSGVSSTYDATTFNVEFSEFNRLYGPVEGITADESGNVTLTDLNGDDEANQADYLLLQQQIAGQALGVSLMLPSEATAMATRTLPSEYRAEDSALIAQMAEDYGVTISTDGEYLSIPANYTAFLTGGTDANGNLVNFSQSLYGKMMEYYGITPGDAGLPDQINPPLSADDMARINGLIAAQAAEDAALFNALEVETASNGFTPATGSLGVGFGFSFNHEGGTINIDRQWLDDNGYAAFPRPTPPATVFPSTYEEFEAWFNAQYEARYGQLNGNNGFMPMPGTDAYGAYLQAEAATIANTRRTAANTAVDTFANNAVADLLRGFLGPLGIDDETINGLAQSLMESPIGQLLMMFFAPDALQAYNNGVGREGYVEERQEELAAEDGLAQPGWENGYAAAPEVAETGQPVVATPQADSHAFAVTFAQALGAGNNWQAVASVTGPAIENVTSTLEGRYAAVMALALNNLDPEAQQQAVDWLNETTLTVAADSPLAAAYADVTGDGEQPTWLALYEAAINDEDGLTQVEADALTAMLPADSELRTEVEAMLTQETPLELSDVTEAVNALADNEDITNLEYPVEPEVIVTPVAFSRADLPLTFSVDINGSFTPEQADMAQAEALAATAQMAENLMIIDEVNGTGYYQKFLEWLNTDATRPEFPLNFAQAPELYIDRAAVLAYDEANATNLAGDIQAWLDTPEAERGAFPINREAHPELFADQPLFMEAMPGYGFENGIIALGPDISFDLTTIDAEGLNIAENNGIGFMQLLARASQTITGPEVEGQEPQPLMPIGFDEMAAQNWFDIRDDEGVINEAAVGEWQEREQKDILMPAANIPQVIPSTNLQIARDAETAALEAAADGVSVEPSMWGILGEFNPEELFTLAPPRVGLAVTTAIEQPALGG